MEWKAGERLAAATYRPEVRRRVALHPEPAAMDGRRRLRLAATMREAYDDLGWVPESVVVRLRDVRVEAHAVVLTLVTGSRIVDRRDRVEILGRVDDVSVAEIVAAVRRHGWPAVTVEGDLEFRVAATKALLALEPPVRVEGSVLSEFEEAEIEDARRPSPIPGPGRQAAQAAPHTPKSQGPSLSGRK